jgi:hypothetical protein
VVTGDVLAVWTTEIHEGWNVAKPVRSTKMEIK